MTTTNPTIMHPCPLCGAATESRYQQRMQRHYHWCTRCDLVSVAPYDHVSADQERERYLEHDNGFHQEGYVRMLTGFLDRVSEFGLGSSDSVLDFGCGYAPVLSDVATARGHNVCRYDPFFFPDSGCLAQTYRAVLSCEVVEHVADPVGLWSDFARLVEPGGTLGIRSSVHPATWERFLKFWYTHDQTHISFYAENTVSFVAERYGFSVAALDDPIWVLIRSESVPDTDGRPHVKRDFGK